MDLNKITTFVSASIPILKFLALAQFYPFNIILSLGIGAVIVLIFLVTYRSRKLRVKLKMTFIEPQTIIITSIDSLLLGGIA